MTSKIKNSLSLGFKAIFIILCLTGVIMNFFYINQNFMMTISYYTIQSNIACLLLITYLFVTQLLGIQMSEKLIRLKAGFTVMIFLTFLVYHFLLRPSMLMYETGYQVFNFSDILVHYVSPLMMLVDFIVFTDHQKIKKIDPFRWLLIPLIYWIYTMFYHAFGGVFINGDAVSSYPYFFLDFELYGFFGVMIWVIGIMILYIGLGYGLFGVDYIFEKRRLKS